MPTLPWMIAPPPVHANVPPMLRGAFSFPLPQGDAGVARTMNLIHQQVDLALKNPYINEQAIEILRAANAPQYDQAAAARVIYDWVLKNIRYVQDPVGKETVRPADVILRKIRAGDCDDINGVLIPSLLGSIGISVRGVTVAAAPYSDDFSHIYAEAFLNGQWVALDAARPNVSFGQSPEYFKRRAEWPLTGSEVGQGGYLNGMAALGDTPIDWVAAIGQQTSGIIQSLRASPQNIIPQSPVVMTPGGTYATANRSGIAVGSSINGTEVIIGLGVLAVLVLSLRHR